MLGFRVSVQGCQQTSRDLYLSVHLMCSREGVNAVKGGGYVSLAFFLDYYLDARISLHEIKAARRA